MLAGRVVSRWEALPRPYTIPAVRPRASRGRIVVSGEPSRGGLVGAGGADGLEPLEEQQPARQALQERQRQPAPDVRHLGAADVTLANPRLGEAVEELPQLAAPEAACLR